MASALRSAARKICSRALQRPLQPCFSATVKEGRRSISHGGSSLRRFSSSESHLVNNNKHGAQSAARAAESPSFTSNAESTPWWSIYHPKFVRTVFLYTVASCTGTVAWLYILARLHDGPITRLALGLEPNPSKKDDQQSD